MNKLFFIVNTNGRKVWTGAESAIKTIADDDPWEGTNREQRLAALFDKIEIGQYFHVDDWIVTRVLPNGGVHSGSLA